MVVCPSCGSSRIRNGYKPASFWLRMIGMRGLLCDSCNFPFCAFSPLPPKSRRPQHAQRKADVFNSAPVVDLSQIRQKPVLEKHEVSVAAPQVKRWSSTAVHCWACSARVSSERSKPGAMAASSSRGGCRSRIRACTARKISAQLA